MTLCMPRTVYFNYAFELDTLDLFKISEYVFPTLLYLIMHTKSWFQPDFLFPCKLCIYPLELDWILLLVFNFTVLWLVICLFLCFLFGLLSLSTLFRLCYLKCYFFKKNALGTFSIVISSNMTSSPLLTLSWYFCYMDINTSAFLPCIS